MKNLIKTLVIFLFCLLLTKNVLADHKNTALLEILEDYVEEEDTLVIEFQKVFSLYRARKPGFVFDSDEFFKNNVLVASFRFGNFVWAYKFCTR